ncbi:MAG: DUF1795 domain-containing protein [Chloroflexota bacterium]|nr:DUF1795 domain-containing protein [Chloroflexota bacterium]MDQ6908852.1 DUF1795 domain-containing protein [Chloroflexota bacterium]
MVRRIRLMWILGLIVLGLIATTAAPVGAASASVFSNDKVAVGILDGWNKVDTPAGLIGQWCIDDCAAVFNITYEQIPSGTSSVDYAVASVNQLTSLPDYKELRRDYVNSGDTQSPRLDYLFTKDGTTLRAQQVFLAKGSDAYVLSFFTKLVDHQDYVDQVDAMVYSFTFV